MSVDISSPTPVPSSGFPTSYFPTFLRGLIPSPVSPPTEHKEVDLLPSGHPVIDASVTAGEAAQILRAAGELGEDPSCVGLSNRTKNIGFFLSFGTRWFQLNRSTFFIHSARSAGEEARVKEFEFSQLPASFLECEATIKLLNAFKKTHNVPDGEVILAQVQATHVTPKDEGKILTGQSPHTDGADKAMIAVLRRDNIKGAQNALVQDLDGKNLVMPPCTLGEGEALLWNDNEIYHMVEPASLEDKEKDGNRTVMIVHYPAEHYLTGKSNLNNKLMVVNQCPAVFRSFTNFSSFCGFNSFTNFSSFSGFNSFTNFSSFSGFNSFTNFSSFSGFDSSTNFSSFCAFDSSTKFGSFCAFDSFTNFNPFTKFSSLTDRRSFSSFCNFSGSQS